MKNLVFVFIFSFSFLSLSAQKRFINSIHLDFFGNQVDGDGYGGYNHVGLHGGVGTLYKFGNSKGALGFEINYAQKGARLWARPNQGGYNDFKFNLNYFEVPVYYVFESWGLPFEIGPTFSYLLDAKREFNGLSAAPDSPYREYELGGVFSMTYPIREQLFFKFRITNSISPILNVENGTFADWAAGSWHRGAGLNITYFFSPPNFKEVNTPETQE